MNYTSEQREAIITTDKNLVVTAGAGAGKTRVLVDRILYILTKELANIEEIVAITYTNKAAVEIKDRLRRALKKHKNKGLGNIREKLGISYIGTIHSFCLRILQENPVEVGIDPEVKVIEEHRAKALLKESIRATLLENLDEDDVFQLTRDFGFEKLLEELYFLIEKMRNQGLTSSVFEKACITEDEKSVAKLIRKSLGAFETNKDALNCLDYEDLLQKTLSLFKKHPEVLKNYQRKFKYIMVDEYQDLNFSQDAILRLLGKGSNFFVVGDKKQSIYGFRGARVELFEQLKKDIKNQGKALNLKDNFRSEEKIIEFVNQSFIELMVGYEPIRHNRSFDGIPNLHYLIPESTGLIAERREYEGELIAQKIIDMMKDESTKVFDTELNKLRAPKFSDFAVLLRKRTHIMSYIKAFEEYNIPFYLADSGGLTQSEGVKALINALETIEFMDEISLYGTLANLLGIKTDSLVDYVLAHGQLITGINSDEKQVSGKLHEAFETIRQWIQMKDRLTLHELAGRIVKKTKLIELCQRKDPLGAMNLFRFLDLCKEYDELGFTLKEFLLEIADFGEDYQEAADTIENEDLVKFVTIHSAKGLEFPIVILADCAQDITVSSKDILFEPEAGVALKKDRDKWDDIKHFLLEKEKDEAKRLLYVALTRARDHLIISGELKNSKRESFIKWLIPHVEQIKEKEYCKIVKEKGTIENTQLVSQDVKTKTKSKQGLQFIKNVQTTCGFYSTTLLGEYLRCPKGYYYKKVIGIPEGMFLKGSSRTSGLSAAERGSLVHLIIEKICKGSLKEQDIDKFIKDYTDLITDEDIKHIKRCLNTYFKSDLHNTLGKTNTEYPFIYQLKDRCYITGIIDFLKVREAHLEIVDFKTNIKIDENLLDIYKFQVQTYALAMTKISDIPIKSAKVASLYEDRSIDIDISSQALNLCNDKLLDLVIAIEGNSFPKANNESRCAYCGYNGVFCK